MKWFALGLIVVVALLVVTLAGMIVFGTAKPPATLRSVTDVAGAIDLRDLPAASHYTARDGARLAYRVYPAASRSAVILIHGSSGSSIAMHATGRALQAAGVTAFALDIRGHGDSGPHGDIAYAGQLEDDLADFVALLRKTDPSSSLTLLGHSSGGGFVVRVAGSSIASLFDHFVLLSPYLGYRAQTVRPASGGWAQPFRPRIIALTILQRFHIDAWSGLPVVAFAVPPELDGILTASYSLRLLQDFGPPPDYLQALARSPAPVTVLVGARDEIMFADRFAGALDSVKGHVDVQVLPGIGHMGIVSDPKALTAVVRACISSP